MMNKLGAAKKAFYTFTLDHGISIERGIEVLKLITSEGFEDLQHLTHIPVDIEQFLFDTEFMGAEKFLYPPVAEVIMSVCRGDYYEFVGTGGIGTAKTTIALYILAYQLYILSCFRDPHEVFGLDPASEIKIIFQSLAHHLAKEVDYARFHSMISRSPYFTKHFPFNPDLSSELRFPNRIVAKPISGLSTAAIGQNVFAGLIDEVNYMAVVDNDDPTSSDGIYDQAMSVYDSASRRRKTRFTYAGKLYGMLCLISSRRYPGEFTDQKEQEAKTDPGIYIYSRRVWEIKPDAFGDERFYVFIGDDQRKPRLLDDDEEIDEKDKDLVIDVPTVFLNDFQKDLLEALREVAGIALYSAHPFFVNWDAVTACLGTSVSVFDAEEADFVTKKVSIIKDRFQDTHCPRFVHIDLSRKKDSTGFAVGYVEDFTEVAHYDYTETMPKIVIDGVLEIKPPPNGEILFWKIRRILYILRDMGVPIKWITFDTWQSDDSRQILHHKGFKTGVQSMDTDTIPYEYTKSAIYDGRLRMPEHKTLRRELGSVEYYPDQDKIDHPSGESKDCLDSVCGVVYGLTMRRVIWHQFGVLAKMPSKVMEVVGNYEPE